MRPMVSSAVVLAGVLATAIAQAEETPPHIDTSGVNMQPAYPASAMANKERGAAVLRVGVTADGRVSEIRPLQTSGFDDLDAAAIATIMGWHFVAAANASGPIPGNTNVSVGFQPPNSVGQSALPLPTSDFLPPAVHLEAREDNAEVNKSIPCANGSFRATIEFLHPLGRGEFVPSSTLTVRTRRKPGPDAQWLDVVLQQASAPMQPANFGQDVYVNAGKGNAQLDHWEYSRPLPFGKAMAVSISWSAAGVVKAMIGRTESHEYRFSSAPVEFAMSVFSSAADFRAPELICYPSVPPSDQN